MTFRSDFAEGATDVGPILPGIVSFGVVAGVAAIDVGFDPVQAVTMSVVAFSGVAQVAAFEMLDRHAPVTVVVATALVANAPFMVLSASIAPYFDRLSSGWKGFLAFFLAIPNYALSIARFDADPTVDRRGYFLGASAPFWASWQVGTAVGAVFGASVPASWGLDFVVPLALIALLVPLLDDRPTIVSSVAAGVLVLVGGRIPFNLGIVLATFGGVAVGLLFARGR